MESNLNEYLHKYRNLIKRRCELDARIDFMSDLIKGCVTDDVLDFELVYYDKDGNVVKKVSSLC